MLAGCNQSCKLFFGSRPGKWDRTPLTPSPKVKSLAPMHACTKAPVKYYTVPATQVYAQQNMQRLAMQIHLC